MGRGSKKITASNFKEWTLTFGNDVIDATTFGDVNRQYITGAFSRSANWDFFSPREGIEVARVEENPTYSISGYFQGEHVDTGDIRLNEDNPVDIVVRQALGLVEDDVLLGISYRDKDGQVKVRPWSGE